jgi:hypothetical protein
MLALFNNRHRSYCQGRALRNEANTKCDEHDSSPALKRKGLLEPETGEQGDDYIAEGSSREHISEIGPRQSSEIADEKADEQRNAQDDPGSEYGDD